MPDVLGLLAQTGQTGELQVIGTDVDRRVWLDRGELLAGTGGNAVTATLELACVEEGWFYFTPGPAVPSGGERLPIASVLRELVPAVDEWRTLSDSLPFDATISMSSSTPADAVEIRADQWQLLSTIGGTGRTIRTVVDTARTHPLDTLRTLRELIDAQLVELSPAEHRASGAYGPRPATTPAPPPTPVSAPPPPPPPPPLPPDRDRTSRPPISAALDQLQLTPPPPPPVPQGRGTDPSSDLPQAPAAATAPVAATAPAGTLGTSPASEPSRPRATSEPGEPRADLAEPPANGAIPGSAAAVPPVPGGWVGGSEPDERDGIGDSPTAAAVGAELDARARVRAAAAANPASTTNGSTADGSATDEMRTPVGPSASTDLPEREVVHRSVMPPPITGDPWSSALAESASDN